MKKSLSFVVFLAAMSVCAISCQKSDGPAGPAGPAGSANVIYSSWFTPAIYTKDTIFGIWGFNYNKSAPEITQQVLDSGVVLTFAKLAGYNPVIWPANQVAQMPVTLTYMSGTTTYDTWTALSTVGNLKIRFINDKNTYTAISTQHQFRYIVIPGGKSNGRLAQRSYAEICQAYHIQE